MEVSFMILVVSCALLTSSHVAVDTITANQALQDGETIVSDGEMFEMGFFRPPGRSKNRYVGIWYKKISTPTVVWVANRETPVTSTFGMFKVTRDGNLLILDGGNNVIWSSNSTGSVRNLDPVAELLDSGNLVVWDNKSSTNRSLIWQSFDYPGDTLLPGMKFGKNLVTGREWYLTSWKSPDDPSPGKYNLMVDTDGYPQIVRKQGPLLLSRLGPWNGLGFDGFAPDIPNPIYLNEFVVNDNEIYHKYELTSLVIRRVVLTSDGKTLVLHWVKRTQNWVVYEDIAADGCARYALCGPFGSCSLNKHPPCTCMEGFEPKFPEEWSASDWSSGCRREKPLDCGSGDGFREFSGVKFPDTRRSWYDTNMTLRECETACRKNCSCTAYADLDIRNGGSGCLLWFHELMDIREYDVDHNIYIRTSEGQIDDYSFNKKKAALVLMLLLSSAALLLSVVAYACKKIKKRPHDRHKRRDSWDQEKMETLDELPFFSLYEIAKATDNFSIDNKIGEGGFGPVYKGVLGDGRGVAVKRLSETSKQGLDEFKNEVICIAKLQHRNLVKLLGYCIHANEMILIYEYMANKSLDLFLFDETRTSMLDWPQRFHIIQGMARGILYLHQDSRIQIIHRDLKAANILLDGDMNPKISDFGLARKFVGHDSDARTKKVVGTYGYISPEYAIHGRYSVKSDVFSFGVIVLEMVSGKKNTGFSHEDHCDNLLGHAWRLYREDKSMELMNASLRDSCVVSEVVRSIHVGLLCVQHHASDRPTMMSVVLMLISEGALPPPKRPAFFNEESCGELDVVSSINDSLITQLDGR